MSGLEILLALLAMGALAGAVVALVRYHPTRTSPRSENSQAGKASRNPTDSNFQGSTNLQGSTGLQGSTVFRGSSSLRASNPQDKGHSVAKEDHQGTTGLRSRVLEAPPPSHSRLRPQLGQSRWWQHWIVDIALAALLALASVALVNDFLFTGLRGQTVLAQIWSVLLVAPLAVRRRFPVESAAAITVLAAGQLLLGFPVLLPADVAILVAIYSVTAFGPRWASAASLVAAGVGAIALALMMFFTTNGWAEGVALGVVGFVLALAAWALGLMRRAQFESWRASQERSEALSELSGVLSERNAALQQRNEALDMQAVALELRTRQLEVERDQQARIAAAAERARIAREMHDIIGHALTNIIVFANGARVASSNDPTVAVEALAAVAQTGTEALATTKQLLGLLRDESAPESFAPEPGNNLSSTAAPNLTNPEEPTSADLAGIHHLVANAIDLGAKIDFQEHGKAVQLNPAATNTLHRVCQEALTNARKHSNSPDPVQVELTWPESQVQLVVTNQVKVHPHPAHHTEATRHLARNEVESLDLIPPPHPRPGYGLIGMRERAALAGGTLQAGFDTTGNTWRVRLTIPIT